MAGNGSGGREAPKGKPFGKPYRLFDLSSDLGERDLGHAGAAAAKPAQRRP